MSNTSLDSDPPASPLLPLETYRIKSLPPNAYYIPSFLTPQESTTLLLQISNHPWTSLTHRRLQPHPAPLTPSGHLLTTKSLPEYLVSPIIDRILSLSFTSPCSSSVESGSDKNGNGIFTNSPHSRPNHVLINEYPPGTGISPHEDGAAYFPVVCTVSLGAHIILQVTPKRKDTIDDNSNREEEENNPPKIYKIFQEPNSLLITTDEMYTEHLHGIEAVEVDEGLTDKTVANWELLGDETKIRILEGGGRVRREEVRISLTYRDVLKVKDAGKVFGGRVLGRR
ncbi:hypothetical protein TWF506_006775 [Arthrobotrys conoides]|uniref:Fe2OG dioxygenase domain-containing protein n=1 Tax=Arthrobotrys conoides TaxID=74498 RepID=A0AAN8NSB4_9PEZI